MDFKTIAKSVIPLVIGILIGAGLTKNRYVFAIILGYFIFMVLFRLLASKIQNVKKSTDKKLAVRNAAVESVNDLISSTEKGHMVGNSIFDKYYPQYVFYINTALLISVIFLLFNRLYYWALVCFLGLNMFVILNQVWRKVKYLDTAEYDKHIKDKIFAEKLKKAEKRQLRKMGVIENGDK